MLTKSINPNGLRSCKRVEVFRNVTNVPNSTKTWLNKLDYVAYYNEEGKLTSISKHQVKDNHLTMKNYKEGQQGFKTAFNHINNEEEK